MKAKSTYPTGRTLVSLAFVSHIVFSLKFLEWIGSLFGMIGTAILAFMPGNEVSVFICYGISNVAFIAFAVKGKHSGLLSMNCAYALFTCIGLFNYWS